MGKLTIFTLTVGQLSTNCYLLIESATKKALIIDPGDDADYIERIIADQHCIPIAVIATHGHFDHILAVTEIALAYTIPFLAHKNDEFLIKNMRRSAKHFLGSDEGIVPKVNKYIENADILAIGEDFLSVISTPGHTPGSICLYNRTQALLFCGDLLFAGGGVGRVDFSYSDATLLAMSLKKVLQLPENTIVYPGHGGASTIGSEKINLGK